MTEAAVKTSLTLKLVASEFGSNPNLSTFDLLSGRMRHRITPAIHAQALSDVFTGEFFAELKDILEKLSDRSMVLTNPDYLFEMQNLRLQDLQVVTAPSQTDGQNTFVTFVNFDGDARSLFASAPSKFQLETADIALNTLDKVASKTFDIVASKKEVSKYGYLDVVRERLNAIEKTRDELLFRLSLLEKASTQGSDVFGANPQLKQLSRH